MAPIQKDATGTHVRDPLVVCAQVVLVLTVVAIVMLSALLVFAVLLLAKVKEKATAVENVGGVHKKMVRLIMTGFSRDVGLHE